MPDSQNSKNLKGESKPQPRQVNTLLHTLRGEQFRHEQNLQRSNAHLVRLSSFHSHNIPTLPFSEIYDNAERTVDVEQGAQARGVPTIPPVRINPGGMLEYAYPRGEVPGPPIPKSWSGVSGRDRDSEVDKEARRADALSLIFSHLPPSAGSGWVHAEDRREPTVPPLTLLCLRVLLSACSAEEFAEDVVPCLPPHLRRDLLRWTAVHSPLSNAKLYALCNTDGHADGELIVVGPQASLPRDYLRAEPDRLGSSRQDVDAAVHEGEDEDEDWSWDSPASHADTPSPLTALILLNTPLSVSTLFTFPPTLTHLALLALPSPAPVHRLPRICPLLEVLDLSFNPWVGQSDSAARGAWILARGEMILDRLEWNQWGRLKVLGLRDCGVGTEIARRVNMGRWVDVEIVGAASRTAISSCRSPYAGQL
ncbi:hypothetical protein SCP_0405470 [Sparassis crispa]|uniref:Uncharacterized protein n=1 Tax=Sparassis crispa TaxID=139825 RepID=A0A401GJ10_9APHY|nr:hypothetical protein SCP_0405470 [Sparassis crispa]GBE82167.1 hypothetical protein SCP_0405470 [Sparassis crispa]